MEEENTHHAPELSTPTPISGYKIET